MSHTDIIRNGEINNFIVWDMFGLNYQSRTRLVNVLIVSKRWSCRMRGWPVNYVLAFYMSSGVSGCHEGQG